MRKLNQKGFSLIEGLLVIIALSLIVFVGYYVWHTQQTTDKTLDSASKSTQNASKDIGSSNVKKKAAASDANLHAYLLTLCDASNKSAIDGMFANKATQTTESDNYQREGDYAITNVSCNLKNGMELTTQILKFTNSEWALLINGPTSVSCSYLTDQGFPDKLKAPFCSNGAGGEGDFNT